MIDVVHNNRNLETTTGTRVTDMECGPENKTRVPHAPNLMSTAGLALGYSELYGESAFCLSLNGSILESRKPD